MKYVILEGKHPSPKGRPGSMEYYGPCFLIGKNPENVMDYDVLIPDPGDGSAESLAQKILELLNGQTDA